MIDIHVRGGVGREVYINLVYFTQSLSPDYTKNHEVIEFYGHGKNNGFVLCIQVQINNKVVFHYVHKTSILINIKKNSME